jgi:CheY-like chemotaxis protein
VGDCVTDDLVTLKVLIASEAAAERALLRRVASQASVPIDVVEVEDAGSAAAVCDVLARNNPDIVFLDSRMPRADRQTVLDAAGDGGGQPLVVLVGPADIKTRQVITDGLSVDSALGKPLDAAEAQAVLGACVRARIPNLALIVDDSSTMRSVVRKVLQASRFRFETVEAAEGNAAIELARKQRFEVVFLDCNMPGLDGFDTLAELRRTQPDIKVVMITAANDQTLADKARAAGAQDLLFKPFYAKDIDAILRRLFGLLPSKAA